MPKKNHAQFALLTYTWNSFASVLLVLSFAVVNTAAEPRLDGRLPETVTFNAHIRPIMSNTCFACHGPDGDKNDSGFRIDSFESATSELPSGGELVGIVPGNPDTSEVYRRIMGISDGEQMPPEEFLHELTDYDKALFKKWIEQGAKYEQHWSYSPIRKVAVPEIQKSSINTRQSGFNEIDAFILNRLENSQLTLSEPADRATLIRRLSLDLIGLPPTANEVDGFVNDDSPDAYEKLVDRLLSSEHYGERMASHWLDIVRFSDTVGFHGDQNQNVAPYRDYVINSFNENKPFDQFTREQFAGDLFEAPTNEELTATALLRLTMMTREGGAQAKEYLAKYKADRVRMVGTAWLGSTLACCECHNHKYDPFTIKDFYSMGAFFDDLQQWGVYSDYQYTPNPDLKGFNNDYPFPPELRVYSEALEREMQCLRDERDLAVSNQLKKSQPQIPSVGGESFKDWQNDAKDFLAANDDGWEVVMPSEFDSDQHSQLSVQPDNSLLVSGEVSKDDEHIVVLGRPNLNLPITSIRVEAMPDASHDGAVGRGADGRFVMGLKASVVRPNQTNDVLVENSPRFIRIEIPGADRILSLAEVQVFVKEIDEDGSGKLVNIAKNGKASQSTDYITGPAHLAIDGNTDGDYKKAVSTTSTKPGGDNPWWELDLGEARRIEKIVVWNRTDGNLMHRLKGYQIVLFNAERHETYRIAPELPKPTTEVEIPVDGKSTNDRRIEIAWAQADRHTPKTFKNGRPARFLGDYWHSGPSVWQLPREEQKLKHTAVFHLSEPLQLDEGEIVEFTISSKEIGRFRISVSPFADANPSPGDWIAPIRDSVNSDLLTQKDLNRIVSLFHRATTASKFHISPISDYQDRISDLQSAMAMTLIAQPIAENEMPVSRVRPRGNWQDESGELAPPAVPHFLPQPPDSMRRLNRLDLANWLVSPENPLTPRHFVNRTWKQFFGTGLSGKLDDLGSQGEWPSHPELLDWLATDFVDSGWDMKHVIRQIVLSQTYRQSSAVRPDLEEFDPYNRLLSQQSPRRLPAEIIRDNALAISGLLRDDYVGGSSVFPYQPAGHYSNLQFPSRVYSHNRDFRQYRRGVYMHWQRTFLHPMLVNFDAPSRDECTADRPQSNSPQQALTLLNDPEFVEAAIAMADRLERDLPESTVDEKLDYAFKITLARLPDEREKSNLLRLFNKQLQHYSENPSDIDSLMSVGMYRDRPEGVVSKDPASHAAWSQVCRVLLNLHETIVRY